MKKLLTILLFVTSLFAQNGVAPMPQSKPQFFTKTGLVCSGCKLSSFVTGTGVPLQTYTDSSGTVQNQNPITMGSDGRPPQEIWLGAFAYDLTLKDSFGSVIYSVKNISVPNIQALTQATLTVTGPVIIAPSNSGIVSSSSVLEWDATYSNGTSIATDKFQCSNIPAVGANPATVLTCNHSGSSGGGSVLFNFPVSITGATTVTSISDTSHDGIQVVGNGTNTNFSATAASMGGTGGGIVPPGYVGSDNAFVNSNGPVILDFRPNSQGSLGFWHGIHALHPVTGFPGGNDIPLDVWGPGDILPANNPVACTSSTSVTPGTTTVTVGTCADTTGKGGPSGTTTAALSPNHTGVTIVVDPGVAGSEETIANASWSIASGTTITATFAKSHTAPYTIWQRGATQVVTDAFSITGVLGLSFTDIESNGTNLINMAGQIGIRPAGDVSSATTQLDVHGPAISSALTCPISTGDNAADRLRLCYSTTSPVGTKNTYGFLSWGNDGTSGDLDVACRGNQPCRIVFWNSPDTGTTGLVNTVFINQLGQIVTTKPTGTPPFIVTSTTNTPNLNASILTGSGTAATLTGTGACATVTTQTGGAIAGRATCTGTTGASTLTITPGTTAPNGWVCSVYDQTTRANLLQQTATVAASCTLTSNSVTQNDVFVFSAIAF